MELLVVIAISSIRVKPRCGLVRVLMDASEDQ
ncbi:MAG: hypothetical protein ACKPHU_15170 [Planctomycetaceae bacterium]